MATVAQLQAAASTAVGPYTPAAFIPVANDLLVVFVVASGTVDATAAVTNSLGVTFTMVTSTTKVAGDTIYAFVSNSLAAASSQTCTITFPADNSTGQTMHVYAITGVTRTGLSAVRQSAVQANGTAATTPAPVFGAAALTANACLGCIGNGTNPATVTPPASWTEPTFSDTGYATPTTGAEVAFRNSGETGTTITWGSTSASGFGAIIVEIDTSAAAVAGLPNMVQAVGGRRGG